MTMKTHFAAALLAFGTPALADTGTIGRGFALIDGGATLLVMPDASRDSVEVHPLDRPLRALAWRPVTGALLGLGDGGVYEVDPLTGALGDLDASLAEGTQIDASAMVGFDVNNAIDAVRAVSTAGDNLVYFPEDFGDNDPRASSLRRFATLAYAAGDANDGVQPMVFANAYTNAISAAKAGSTVQYALDAATDALVTLANNEGTLTTVATVTIGGRAADFSAWGGFDIVSPAEGTDHAFAVLHLEGAASAGLYRLDLTTGEAVLLRDLGRGGLIGFALAPAM